MHTVVAFSASQRKFAADDGTSSDTSSTNGFACVYPATTNPPPDSSADGTPGLCGLSASPSTNTWITDPSLAGFVAEFSVPSAFSAATSNSPKLNWNPPGTANIVGFAAATGNSSCAEGTPFTVTVIRSEEGLAGAEYRYRWR